MALGEKKIMVTFALDKDVAEEVKQIQLDTQTFSRSEVLRQLITLGLQKLDEEPAGSV